MNKKQGYFGFKVVPFCVKNPFAQTSSTSSLIPTKITYGERLEECGWYILLLTTLCSKTNIPLAFIFKNIYIILNLVARIGDASCDKRNTVIIEAPKQKLFHRVRFLHIQYLCPVCKHFPSHFRYFKIQVTPLVFNTSIAAPPQPYTLDYIPPYTHNTGKIIF